MAKGTLLASAKTTKRGGPAATAKKAAITSTRPAAAAAPAVLASKKAKKAELSSDGVDAASLDGAGPERRKLRTNDPKYSRHYKLVMKESLEGMDLSILSLNIHPFTFQFDALPQTVHAEDQSKVETILKLFDLNAEYLVSILFMQQH
ncbi:MAG: hypothetical protein CYPHOPRED_004867 [Cyphobasidiales sp. Tagirdzhanova-0007]|nr:MAG: hypothetical protein CYPHOPRED_004867 [Cyphobasidiales sp. Tagirdzhanova-0007]